MLYRFDGKEFKAQGIDLPFNAIPFVDNELVIAIKCCDLTHSIVVARDCMTDEFFKQQIAVWMDPAMQIYVRSRDDEVLQEFIAPMIFTLGGIRKGVFVAFEPALSSGIKSGSGVIINDCFYYGLYEGKEVHGNPMFSVKGEFCGLIVNGELKQMSALDITRHSIFALSTVIKVG